MKLYFRDESGTLRTVVAEGLEMDEILEENRQGYLKSFIQRGAGIRPLLPILEVFDGGKS